MRNFLTDIRIVGATMAFREGELIRHCLDQLLSICDEVMVMLDNYDEKTEKIVKSYAEKYDNFSIIYSKEVPRLSEEDERVEGNLKRRLKSNRGQIRDQVLRGVEKIHKRRR